MSMSSATTLTSNHPPPQLHNVHHHVAHTTHHHKGPKRRTSSTSHGHGHGHGLHRTRSHASTTNLPSTDRDRDTGHTLQRTNSHGAGTRRDNALAALQGMTAAPSMDRQNSKSESEDGSRNGGGGKSRRKSGARTETKRSHSSTILPPTATIQSRSDTSLHRSHTEPARPTTDAPEEEWESGDESGEVDGAEGAVTNNTGAPPALSPTEEDDAGLELQIGRKSGIKTKERGKLDRILGGMTATQPMMGGAGMEKNPSQTGLPGGQAMSRQGSKQSQIGFDTGKDSNEGLHRVPTIGFDVGTSKEETMAPSSAYSTAKGAEDVSTSFQAPPLREGQLTLDQELPTTDSAVLLEPSLLKAERSAFITTPLPEKSHSAPPEQSTSSETQRSHRRESTASTQQAGGSRHLRTRNSHTSLRSLQSLRAPPHPLNSPTHARSRVTSLRGGAPPVVNIEPAKAVWSGKDVEEDGEGDDDAVGLLPNRLRGSGITRSTSSRSGFGGDAEVSLRKASFSSIRDLPGETRTSASGINSSCGGESAAGRLSAQAQLANSTGGATRGDGSGGRPGSIHGSIGSSAGSGSTGRAGGSAPTTNAFRDEWDQSHLVSRFLTESQRQRKRPRKGVPDVSSDQVNLVVPWPELPIVKAHASLVLNMRQEKQMHARPSGVRGGAAQPSYIPGLSPFEMSMQRVLAQRAVAVSTSGLAGLGVED